MEDGFFTSSDDGIAHTSPPSATKSSENMPQRGRGDGMDDLSEFVRALIETGDKMAEVKDIMRPHETRLKELKQKYNQLRVIIAGIMQKMDIDTLEPEGPDGVVVAKLTVTKKTRSRPTIAALEQAVLDNCLNGDSARLRGLREKALSRCPPPSATLRCTRRKT